MENQITIEQYIANQMSDKIAKRAKSPLGGIITLAVGIVLLILMRSGGMADSLMALCLTGGILATAVGLVLTAMCLTRTLTSYVYLPTKSKMKEKKLYLSASDYSRCIEALDRHDGKALEALQTVVSSNSALRVMASRDGSIVLAQAGRYDSGRFEEETPVYLFNGTEFAVKL